MQLPTPTGKVQVQKLFYRAPTADKVILKDINLDIPAGTFSLLIGPSGAGKTTLLRLLAGVETPTSGSVRIDGAEVSAQTGDYGKYIGYLAQDIGFFNGTVAENIARMELNADSQKVVEAAQKAGVHELILSLPQGYQTQIGINGVDLSAGQKQRIGLARALYGDVKVLLLDEPNAHLDEAGESILIQALHQAKLHKITCFVISHKTRLLAIADYCIILKDGALAEFTTPDKVREKYSRNNMQVVQGGGGTNI
jgi:ABC-type protease/lipase transport system fused ATPase/permease subunit